MPHGSVPLGFLVPLVDILHNTGTNSQCFGGISVRISTNVDTDHRGPPTQIPMPLFPIPRGGRPTPAPHPPTTRGDLDFGDETPKIFRRLRRAKMRLI